MDYKTAGVDIEAGYESVELMKKYVKETMRPEVLGGLGGFNADLHQLILGVLKAYRTLVTIDMEGVSVVPPVFYGYADGGLGSHLPGTLRKKEFERVGIDQRGCHEEKYQEQEHNVRHGGH